MSLPIKERHIHALHLFLEIIGHIGVVDHFTSALLHSGAVLRSDLPIVFQGSELITGNEFGLAASNLDRDELGLAGLDILKVTAAHLVSTHRVLLIGLLVRLGSRLEGINQLVRLGLGLGGRCTSEKDGGGNTEGSRSDLTASGRKGRRGGGLSRRGGSKCLGGTCRRGDDQSGDDLHDSGVAGLEGAEARRGMMTNERTSGRAGRQEPGDRSTKHGRSRVTDSVVKK